MKHSCHAIRHRSSARPGLSGERPSVRGGFTLVEMMVSIALVMLIMLMFAAVFEVVADTMSAQKGIAKNDQKARTLTILMKEDLEHRTFRRVVPFFPGQDTGSHGPFYSRQQRRGYFSISENDPDNNTDDVLAFTAQFPVPVSGRATLLDPLLDINDNLVNQNQPEFDDGSPFRNGIGVSRTVEIAYFLRNGNLYRRVMLVREPYDDEGTENVQPDELLTGNYISEDADNDGIFDGGEDTNNNGVFNTMFWRDFDYSAFRISSGLQFHGTAEALSNVQPITGAVPWDNDDDLNTPPILLPPSLGIPHLRFGHSLSRLSGTPPRRYGTPREFVNNGFIGRFTTQETAHSAFGYPGIDPGTNNDPYNINLTLNTSGIYEGLVGRYAVEPNGAAFRRGEDILLSNVHEFDIKVWDDYDEDYNGNGSIDVLYEEAPGADDNNNSFQDFITEDINGNGVLDSVQAFVDLGHNLIQPNGNPANQPIGYYHRNNVLNTSFSPFNRFRYDTWHPFEDTSVPPINLGMPPFRPLRVYNSNDGVPGTFQDDDGDGFLNDLDRIELGVLVNPGEQGWLGSDDEVPLKAIQITIRFFDVSSDQMRQLTLIFTLTD